MPTAEIITDTRRWILEKKAVARDVARKSKQEEINHLKAEIEEKREELARLRKSPLCRFVHEYTAVFPGDPRYETAETFFDPRKFAGTWKFVTFDKP